MKKVIIIILAVLLVADIGVLAYGISRGKDNEFNAKVGGLKQKPAESVYANAENYISFADMTSAADSAEKMADILVKTTYNLIESTGFYVLYRTDILASDGSSSCSENFRAVSDSCEVYQTLTSASKFEKRQIEYYNEKLLQKDNNL
ncbi:MAG: hypothetical protein IJU10_01350, partial [Clostridia bacterium]|nr:hypothetical protein [Clostridia bacterium]